MERLLLLWDDLDDFVGACRHVATSAAEEVAASVSAPLMAAVSAIVGAWLLLPIG